MFGKEDLLYYLKQEFIETHLLNLKQEEKWLNQKQSIWINGDFFFGSLNFYWYLCQNLKH